MNWLMVAFGLGDLAYWVFWPGVHLIDFVWNVEFHLCAKCRRRREQWNALFAVPRWLALSALTIIAAAITWSLL